MPLPRCLLYLCFLLTSCFCLEGTAQQINTSCNGLQITGFKIFNSDLPIDSVLKLTTIELSNQQNSFSIIFSRTDSTEPAVYYYQLEGSDKDWIKAPNSAVINYTILPPGKYNFRIRCQSSMAGVSREYIALRIDINLPFWLSGWFVISCFVFFVGAVYYLYSIKIKRLIAIEAVRQRVSRDLHDDIGSTLSTINILSMMAKSKLKEDPSKALGYIDKISDNSTNMMDAMDDIVWSINPANDSMQKIMARMRSFSTEVLEPKGVELHLHFDEALNSIHLGMEARRDLFLLFKEAVNNAAKYSNATKVSIEMQLNNKLLKLTVMDNGKGFDTDKADGGNGLNNMQKRAVKLKSNYAINSEPGNGTTITLEMPVM